MRIGITIELRRPARRSVVLLLGLLLLGAPAVALASHQFGDVPNGHPFHDEIGAIAAAGITAGFNDGTYRPGDPVTRQAMAAFMERGFGRVRLAIGTTVLTSALAVAAGGDSVTAVPVRQITITVPGASNAFSPQQQVYLQGRIQFGTAMSASGVDGCPCEFEAFIRDMTTNSVSPIESQTFESSTPTTYRYSFNVEALFAAPPGARTYQLEVGLTHRQTDTLANNFTFNNVSSLSAATFPFDAT
ncbi:MAG: S-layer homology domain-containing protein [Candidatus Limnocylindrales bacterium]